MGMGAMELIVIGVMALLMIGVPLAVTVLVVFLARRQQPPAMIAGVPCPHCGGWTVPQARFCHLCGHAMAGGEMDRRP